MQNIHKACVFGGIIGLLSGCATEAPDATETVASTEQAIVNGTATKKCDPALDAVAGVVFRYTPGEYEEFYCSATLIAPKVALTARHCVSGDSGWHFDPTEPDFENFVVFGNDVEKTKKEAKIKSFLAAPPGPTPGLLGDGGRDLAVLYLEKAPKGITPAKLGEFKPSLVGKKFRIAGFGQTEAFTFGTKYEGLVTARALSGDWYPLLFKNKYAAFDEWYWTDASLAAPSDEEEALWWTPGTFSLEPGFELLAGGLPGEAVGCWGDSGGPLLQGQSAAQLTLYGVSFAAEGSIAKNCGLGGGYAVLNKENLAFVKGAIAAAP